MLDLLWEGRRQMLKDIIEREVVGETAVTSEEMVGLLIAGLAVWRREMVVDSGRDLVRDGPLARCRCGRRMAARLRDVEGGWPLERWPSTVAGTS